MRKKILSFLLAIALFWTSLPLSSFAEEGSPSPSGSLPQTEKWLEYNYTVSLPLPVDEADKTIFEEKFFQSENFGNRLKEVLKGYRNDGDRDILPLWRLDFGSRGLSEEKAEGFGE